MSDDRRERTEQDAQPLLQDSPPDVPPQPTHSQQEPQPTSTDDLQRVVTLLTNEVASLRHHVAQNDDEIDALQVAASGSRRRWFQDTGLIISVVALLFSFGTTAVSYYRVRQQDVQAARAELNVFLQRLNELPMESAALRAEYDPAIANQLTGYLSSEATFIASQAADVMDQIPEHVSATEYIVVADAFANAGEFEQAERLIEKALDSADNLNEEVVVLRTNGQYQFLSGDIEGGRASYQEALALREKYPSQINGYHDWLDALTRLHWSTAEARVGNCDQAREQLDITSEIEQAVLAPTGIFSLAPQLAAQQAALAGCVER